MAGAVNIIGDRFIREALKAVSRATQNKVMRPAVRAALVPISRRARENVPVRTGIMRSAIKPAILGTGKRSSIIGRVYIKTTVTTINPPEGKAKLYDPANIAHYVEFGTKTAAPHPFMRPALEASRAECLHILTVQAEKHLQRVAARAAKAGRSLV
jgi:HK97 gp10 family phage protein